jgi:DNA-binding response OmpR family regulator
MMTQPVVTPLVPRPCLPRVARVVVALTDGPEARAVQATFRRQGWEVHVPTEGADARDVVRQSRARAVVLDTAPNGQESGYLTCKKLLLERPATKVVLVGENLLEDDRRLAAFVGASALVAGSNPLGVVSAVMGLRLRSLS